VHRLRALALAGAAAAAVVLFVVLRPGGGEAEPPATTVAAATTTAPVARPKPTVKPKPKPRPKPKPISIAVRDGRVAGGIARPAVRMGTIVRLVVRADVHDHVHVHGYDLMRDVAPGRPARLSFRATTAGRFEIELEEAGLPIAELEVKP
jgi:hypothetical protein